RPPGNPQRRKFVDGSKFCREVVALEQDDLGRSGKRTDAPYCLKHHVALNHAVGRFGAMGVISCTESSVSCIKPPAPPLHSDAYRHARARWQRLLVYVIEMVGSGVIAADAI